MIKDLATVMFYATSLAAVNCKGKARISGVRSPFGRSSSIQKVIKVAGLIHRCMSRNAFVPAGMFYRTHGYEETLNRLEAAQVPSQVLRSHLLSLQVEEETNNSNCPRD